MMARRSGGFTLLEMLVVFGVFALIGVISSRIVSEVIDNQQVLRERGARLTELQRAMQIIQRDVMQLVNRPVRDQLGDPLPPLIIGDGGLMELTRLGWRNPLDQRRSEVQRVGYVIEEGDLFRAYWRVLDRTPETEPELQRLLSDVDEVEIRAIDASGNEHSFWPLERSSAARGSPAGARPQDPGKALTGIVLRLEAPPFGAVERIWAVPSV